MSEEQILENEPRNKQLEFTGNWFIDAGILGFVNLMEEVYGWDLEELNTRICENENLMYYGYFPIAYVYHNNKVRNSSISKPLISEEYFKDCKPEIDYFNKALKFIEQNYLEQDKGRINLSSSGIYYYFHNLLFFQSKRTLLKQTEDFKEIFGLKPISESVLQHMDKTTNKFLPSVDEFCNILYTSEFTKIPPNQLLFILTFPLSFNALDNKVLFYSPHLDLTYVVNKKLKKVSDGHKNSIFNKTWEAIIDAFVELKSAWSLSNMYIIKYNLGKNQTLFNVEFIGIPKLQATIILDDTIRESLNKSIPYRKKKEGAFYWVWLLQELIKGKALFPIISNNLSMYINSDLPYLSLNSSLYGLAVDIQIKNAGENKSLFNQDFFKNYEYIVDNIRKTASVMSLNKNCISDLFPNKEENKKLSYELLVAVKCKDKNNFLNVISKELINKTGKGKEKLIELYIQKNIVQNDICWENYALPLIMGLVV